MDFVDHYRIASPFSFAAAIVAICDDGASAVGDCFVFVENSRPFIGFQRVKLAQVASLDGAHDRIRQEVRRIHEKMCNAAKRNGRLPGSAPATTAPDNFSALPDLIYDLRRRRGFAEMLEWVGKTTASSRLRSQINHCRAGEHARP